MVPFPIGEGKNVKGFGRSQEKEEGM